jgi:hypothetical protein
MRHWMNLFEAEAPPEMLFHGTPLEHLINIFIAGAVIHRPGIDQGHHGVSLTSDIDTAKGFAHEDCHDSSVLYLEVGASEYNPCKSGTILYFKSADLGRLERYDDTDGDWESEWRTYGDIPVGAITAIALIPQEVEAWRSDYIRMRTEYGPKKHAHMNQDWHDGINQWLHSDKVLAAVDAILASPLLVRWPI